jgi:tRNA (mo5U34)-methyltransferase
MMRRVHVSDGQDAHARLGRVVLWNDAAVEDPRAAVAANPLWYHAIEVAPGVETPGWFDLRPTIELLPWPEVAGKRCLDVGTYDGFFAFELERRGAAEVVATDIADHEQWDWPPRIRAQGVEYLRQVAGPEKGRGFEIARELLGSGARLEQVSVYELSPERVGEFDVVVCGSLLLHLRDPVAGLMAIASVCRGQLLCTNEVDLRLSGRTPVARLDGVSDLCQWWVPSPSGHRRLVEAAGFEVEREAGPYPVPYGPAHPPVRRTPREVLRRVRLGGAGVPHHAVLARRAASGNAPSPG